MQNLLFDELCIKRLKKHFLIFAIACVCFISAVYTPVYLLLSTNALWDSSILLFLWTELIGPVMEFTFYWGSFAFLIYVYLRFGKKQISNFVIIYLVAVLARYLFSMLINFAIMAFPGWETFWEEEFWGAFFSAVMDGLQMLGVLLLAEFCCCRPLMSKTSSLETGREGILAACLPVTESFNIKQPFQKLCFFSALIPAGLKMLMRLYYDITFIGLPQDLAELILMTTYYIGDIASLLIGYLVLLYVLQLFYTAETKRRINFES